MLSSPSESGSIWAVARAKLDASPRSNGTLNTDLLASGIGTGQEFLSDINIFVK